MQDARMHVMFREFVRTYSRRVLIYSPGLLILMILPSPIELKFVYAAVYLFLLFFVQLIEVLIVLRNRDAQRAEGEAQAGSASGINASDGTALPLSRKALRKRATLDDQE